MPLVIVAASFLATSIASAQSSSTQVAIARSTVIPVVITKDIRVGGLGDAREEKKVRFQVAQDVILDGFIIAKAGDLAEGHFTTQKNVTKRVFSADVSQELALDVDDIVNFCGDTIHMEFERTFVGGGRAGLLSLGPHAHDAVFAKGDVLKAQTDRLEKSVCAEKTSQTALPLPSNMVVSDDEAAAASPTAPTSQPLRPAPAVTPPVQQATPPSLVTAPPAIASSESTGSAVLSLAKSGPSTTAYFSVGPAWAIAWQYDCSKTGAGNSFTLTVLGGSYQSPIAKDSPNGNGTTYFHDAGSYYIEIATKCSWNMRVYQ